jgi:mono/diheme cytochrome c family protein
MNAARHSHRRSWPFKALVAGLLFLMGSAEMGNAVAQTALAPSASPDYTTEIQPIFNRRCIACHGCLGSPCNVKLDSFRGVDRGGYGVNP